MDDKTVKELMEISKPTHFENGQYICYEGEPGNEMYIILKGSVGVYVSTPSGEQAYTAKLEAGDFFGEMAILNDKPRSASCIALGEVICVSIDKSILKQFLITCPEMAIKIMESMSMRIRRQDETIYKLRESGCDKSSRVFEAPVYYKTSHLLEEPSGNIELSIPITSECPICGEVITVFGMKKQLLTKGRIMRDGRLIFDGCEPIWRDVWTCPYCRYSNYYKEFFGVPQYRKGDIKKIVFEQHASVLKEVDYLKTPLDFLVMSYLQAIHINESVNMSNTLLITKLWLSLFWLVNDGGVEEMRNYCAETVLQYIEKLFEENNLRDDFIFQQYALIASNLYNEMGKGREAMKMCYYALDGRDSNLRYYAEKLKNKIVI